jgi:hypothetical protein
MAANALADAYKTFRHQARLIIDDALIEEFEALFPETITDVTKAAGNMSVRQGYDPIRAENAKSHAQGLLARLAGWLDGFVSDERE